MLEIINLRLIGTSPLMVANPQTVNPLEPASKAIKELTNKRKRTDAEDNELHFLKFSAALYIDADGPYLPAYNIIKSGMESARLSKQGKMWERGVATAQTRCQIQYSGPRDVPGLWADRRFVDIRDGKVSSGSRIVVTRPVFPDWALDVSFSIAPDVANVRDILSHISLAGRLIGLGTFRARFGRYRAQLVDGTKEQNDLADQFEIEAIKTRKAA